MKSKVYFVPVSNADPVSVIQDRLRRLLAQSRFLDFITAGQKAVFKIHFGEEGNAGYVKPQYVRVIADLVLQKNAQPILSDTNTLYRGMRTNSVDHKKIALRHGFTMEEAGADVVIPENTAENSCEVPVGQKFIKTAKVARLYLECDALIAVSHFKGHIMTGFGGALKNIGMGCATREGKLAQHSDVAPVVQDKRCTSCGACIGVCPANAISRVKNIAFIDADLCIGCASCIAACDFNAIEVDWESGSAKIQDKMVEYAKAVLDRRRGRVVCINFATKITKECDCLAKDDPRISPDVGIFISDDPVAVDKACYDRVLAVCGEDVFRDVHPHRDGMRQLGYAAELGLGNLEYELVAVE